MMAYREDPFLDSSGNKMQQVGERMALNDTCGWAYFKIFQSSYIIIKYQTYQNIYNMF